MLFRKVKRGRDQYRIVVNGEGNYKIEALSVNGLGWGWFDYKLYHTREEALAVIDTEIRRNTWTTTDVIVVD